MISRKTRIKDIARLAGVSIGTVDRVIHERGEVAAETREKVRRILKETNYSPNMMASVLKSKKRYHLVSLLPEPSKDNSFWEKHSSGINQAIKDLDLFNLTLTQVTFDMFNEKDFQKKTNYILEVKPDGVLLAPIFKTESTIFCSSLRKRRIPFVFVDGYIDDTDFLAYIGEDIFRSGRIAGQLTDMVTPENGDILIVNIARNIQNIHHLSNRIKGFMSWFERSGHNRGQKINISIPDPSSGSIKKAMDKAFDDNPGISSVFMSGSKSYLIASYLMESGYSNVNLVGYDLLERNIKFLRSGTIKFLIGQRPEEQSHKAVRKLFEFLSLNRIPERIEYLPVDIVTSENVDFFI